MNETLPIERIENKILLLRGQKVMLDFDLAKLYKVKPKILNQAVKRNIERFPEDFMFKLSHDEVKRLRSQIVTLEIIGRGKYSKFLPYAFTENGVAMLSSVLRSKYAIQVNVQIMRAFTRLRRLLTNHIEVSRKLKELEERMDKTDVRVEFIFETINRLLQTEDQPKKPIGFLKDRENQY